MAANPPFERSSSRRLLRVTGLLVGAAATLAAAPSSATQDAALVADIYLQGPTVLAFVPSSKPLDGGTDPSLALALAAQALSRTAACLDGTRTTFQLLVADEIIVHDGPRVIAFDVTGSAPLVGALLLAQDKNPSLMFAGGGPASLGEMLPRASGAYFHRPCLEQEF